MKPDIEAIRRRYETARDLNKRLSDPGNADFADFYELDVGQLLNYTGELEKIIEKYEKLLSRQQDIVSKGITLFFNKRELEDEE